MRPVDAALVAAARAHAVLPIVAAAIGDGPHGTALAEARAAERVDQARVIAGLVAAAAALTAAGVPFVACKGPVLGVLAYGDPYGRMGPADHLRLLAARVVAPGWRKLGHLLDVARLAERQAVDPVDGDVRIALAVADGLLGAPVPARTSVDVAARIAAFWALAGCSPGLEDGCEYATADLGLPYCVETVGDVTLKVVAPADPAPGAPIAVYLHGDTANGWYEDWGFESLADWTDANGRWLVAPLAPNGCSWWRAPDECALDVEDDGHNADSLAAALDAFAVAHAATVDDARYVGYSGGSTFLTGHWIPRYGDTHPGVIAANCGGEAPVLDFGWDGPPPAGTSIAFTYGTEDFMAGADGAPNYVGEAVAWYTAAGFAVTDVPLEGYGHCDAAYDWDAQTIEVWER